MPQLKFKQRVNAGLKQDETEHLQPPNSYRLNRNKRLIDNGGNNLSLESMDGTSIGFTLRNPTYSVIAAVSLGNNIYILSTPGKSSAAGDIGEIGVFSVQPNTGGGTYGPLYIHEDLNLTSAFPISPSMIRVTKENDEIERLKWTDDFNEPRSLNVTNPRFLLNYLSGALVVGDQYMVLTNDIIYDGVTYGPDHVNANIFTVTTAGGTTYTNLSVVRQYWPIELLDWSAGASAGDIHFQTYFVSTGGKVKCGAYIAGFRLYDGTGFYTP